MCRKSLVILFTTLSMCSQSFQPAFSTNLGIGKTAGAGLRKLFAGAASFYADRFHGKRTASGERFDQNKLTCAHRYLPFGTRLLVENPENGNIVVVTVNDRGPFCHSRVIDLSKAAARRLGITGVGRVVCFTGKGVEEASIKSLRKIGELAAPIVAINASDPGEETTTIIRYAETPNKHEHMQIAGLSNSSRPPIDETY
jgi:rare lipoprotein A